VRVSGVSASGSFRLGGDRSTASVTGPCSSQRTMSSGLHGIVQSNCAVLETAVANGICLIARLRKGYSTGFDRSDGFALTNTALTTAPAATMIAPTARALVNP
jgi:hypothetical protein